MSQHMLDHDGRQGPSDLLRTGFHVRPERIGETVVLRLQGELDMATAVALRQAVGSALQGRPPVLTLDLVDLSFVDSTGIGAIVGACHRAKEMGCEFSIQGPTRSVLKALRLTGVDKLMPIRTQPSLN